MKTSNKLLIALVLLLFSCPLVLMMGFKAAVKANRYTIKSYLGYSVSKPKELKSFSVIKLNGIPGQTNYRLNANIKYGNKFSYLFMNYDENHIEDGRSDSCTVKLLGDTLLIDYNMRVSQLTETNYHNGIQMEIIIPHAVSVFVDGAIVNVDSSATAFEAMSFQLSNNAILNISHKAGDSRIQEQMNQKPIMYPALNILANNALINIGDGAHIKNLKLDLKGKSSINFTNEVLIDSLSGQIADESIFDAPYKFSKFLK